jgi:hypothetical protein
MTDTNQHESENKVSFVVPSFLKKWIDGIPKSTVRAILLFLTLGAGIGIAFGLLIKIPTWYQEISLPSNDLGSVNFDAIGLKGHLITKWDQQTEYRFKLEPIQKDRTPIFEKIISDPPKPLFIKIDLMDSSDFVLCSRNIIFKFNFLKDIKPVETRSSDELNRVASSYANASINKSDWEKGNDFFNNALHSDGTVNAVTSQGTLPCTKSAYMKVMKWNFSSNFPTVDEQDNFVKTHAECQLDDKSTKSISATKNNQSKHAINSDSNEGDDVVSGYSVIQNNLETSGGMTFFIYKDGERDNAIAWGVQDARIHYHCDDSSLCTLSRTGTPVVLHARREK